MLDAYLNSQGTKTLGAPTPRTPGKKIMFPDFPDSPTNNNSPRSPNKVKFGNIKISHFS